MTVFLFFVGGVLLVLLIFIASARPVRSSQSIFELRRRQKQRDKKAEEALRREELLTKMSALKTPLTALCLVLLAMLLIYLLDWSKGILTAVLVSLLYGRLAQASFVRKVANNAYRLSENRLLDLVSKHEGKLRLLSGKASLKDRVHPLGSREELAHLLEASPIFTDEDKRLLTSALRFKERTIKDIMTLREDVVTVEDTELLGPLVLDDLHKTGHTIFPVTKAGRIVGLLDSTDHVELRTKESVHARSVMRTEITWVRQNASLDEALRTLITVNQPLLIVVDDDDQEVGILSLGDIIRSLTGWKRR